MKIAIGGDHAGFEYKQEMIQYLKEKGYEVTDFGPETDASCDYPDYTHPLADAVEKGEQDRGIVICGSGVGVSIVANKHQGVRAALCWQKEIAELCRLHNDANVIALPARFISMDEAKEFVDTFLTTAFEGDRHIRRVNKIPC